MVVLGFFVKEKIELKNKTLFSSQKEEDKYLTFTFEVYDKIKENYWEKISDSQLTDLFLLAQEKLTGQVEILKTPNKENLKKLLAKKLNQIEDEEKKKEFVTKLSDLVLVNFSTEGPHKDKHSAIFDGEAEVFKYSVNHE